MGKLLYESRGKLSARNKVQIVCVVALFLCSISLFVLSGAESEGIEISSYVGSIEDGFENLHRIENSGGTWGGGPVFSEKQKAILWVLACLPIIAAGFALEMIITDVRCWIKIYSDHIEGQPKRFGSRNEVFSLPLEKISFVTENADKRMVILHAGGKQFKVTCPDYKEVFQCIDTLMRREKQNPRITTTRHCVGCGKILAANARFCPVCGTRNEV